MVRNDTGVFEGGEISRFYDPMIAKLCTWGPDRAAALEEMRVALDTFEVEGIGHNLPFVQAVMDHPKFIAGEMTTAFIEEEYPEGFAGAELPKSTLAMIARVAVSMQGVCDARAKAISGQLRADSASRLRLADWPYQVFIGAEVFTFTANMQEGLEFGPDAYANEYVFFLTDETGKRHANFMRWAPGDRMAILFEMPEGGDTYDAELEVAAAFGVDRTNGGFRVRYRGADLDVNVYTPRQAELAALMPVKTPPDTSKMLLCPMPGLVVSIAVEEGAEVQEGQALCTVEAMKMENVLRAEKKGVVAKINAAPGASLAVDDVIMEFE